MNLRIDCVLNVVLPCLVQAFVKLRGDGLAYNLAQVEFRFAECTLWEMADVYLNGCLQRRYIN